MRQRRLNWETPLLLFIGSLSWSLTMIKSGLPTKWGLGFWGANGHDAIWHLSLIESIKQGFPVVNPLFSPTPISNYHWGFDLIIALASKWTGLSAGVLYFQILPPLMAIAIGVLTFLLIKEWTGSKKAANWATFFTFFGGSFGWFITYLRSGQLGGESLFWSQQSISTLINPPFALSLVFLIGGFYLVIKGLNPKFPLLVLQIIIFGLLFFVKSYAGVIGLAGLTIIAFWQVLIKKQLVGLWRAGGAIIITVLLFLWTAPQSSGLLVLEPLWFPRTMIEAPDRLFIPKLAEAFNAYLFLGLYSRVIILSILITTVFILGNIGTRILGLIYLLNLLKGNWRERYFDLALIGMSLIALIFPLVFVQKGTTWNTIQFFYYGQIFVGWTAGIEIARLKISKPFYKKLLLLSIILFTLPTSFSSLYYNYLPNRPPATLPFNELSALNFLKREPPGTVLTYPYEKPALTQLPEPPIPLRKYTSTAYVSAYSGKPSYLADSVNLDILGVPWKQRHEQAMKFFTAGDTFMAMRFLRDNRILYVYLSEDQVLPGSVRELGLSAIYSQAGIRIYRVDGL